MVGADSVVHALLVALTVACAAVGAASCSDAANRPRDDGSSRDTPAEMGAIPDGGMEVEPPPEDAGGQGDGEVGAASGRIAASSVELLGAGGTLVLGTLHGMVALGPEPLVEQGAGDLVLAAFDSTRTLLWARRFGDGLAQGGGTLAVDPTGNIIVGSSFQGVIDFGAGALTSAGGTDVALAKLTPQGGVLWSHRFGDAASQTIAATAVDASGRVVAAATSRTRFDFDAAASGNGSPSLDTANSSLAVFQADSGALAWSRSWSGVWVGAVAVDPAGRIVVSGSLSDAGPVDFGGGGLVSAGHNDVFVAVLSDTGAHLWSKRFGGLRGDNLAGMAVDPDGNILLTGSFDDTLDFGGAPLVSVLGVNRSYPSREVFVAKLDAAGNHMWSRQFGEPEDEQWGVGVASDGRGHVLVSGGFVGTIDVGRGLFGAASGTGFILELDATGAPVWSAQVAGPPADLRVRAAGRILLAGDFARAPVTDPAPTATWNAGAGTFLVEYGR